MNQLVTMLCQAKHNACSHACSPYGPDASINTPVAFLQLSEKLPFKSFTIVVLLLTHMHAHVLKHTTCWSAGLQSTAFNISSPTLRATSAGSVHAMHFDAGLNTLLVVLQGQKAVTLVPRQQLSYLYPFPSGHIFARRAQVDLESPDYERFPLSKLLTPMKFVLQPGDMLFFSASVPHHTVSQTDVVSLTFRIS